MTATSRLGQPAYQQFLSAGAGLTVAMKEDENLRPEALTKA